jgi:hypothetical protein
MSMGGDFYAITDVQLQQLLDESIDYAAFLHGELAEQPRECFSDGEYLWFELTQLLDDESACGYDTTFAVPESSGYAFAVQVKQIAQALSQLSDDEIRQRCERIEMNEDDGVDAVVEVVLGLTAFYQRAASHGDAVLFRVT